MKLFISWSGKKSKKVAEAVHKYFPDIINDIEPFMSKADIEGGERWGSRLDDELEKTKFGIICLTKNNLTSPWLLYEAGAIAKTVSDTFVCPYLVDMEPSDVPQGPFSRFQAKKANKSETLDLLKTINGCLEEKPLKDDRLERNFNRCWNDIESILSNLPEEGAPEKRDERGLEDMVREILDIARNLARKSERDTIETIKGAIADLSMRGQLERHPSTPGISDTQTDAKLKALDERLKQIHDYS